MTNILQGRVEQITEIATGHFELTFRLPELPPVRPGQFLHLLISDSRDPFLRRPFSIYDLLEEEQLIKLLFKAVGRGTKQMSLLAAGDVLDIIGPLGNGFEIFDDGRDELLIGGGVGAAPLNYLSRKLLELGKTVTFFNGAATASQLIDLPALHEAGRRALAATDDGSAGFRGRVTGLLLDRLSEFPPPERIYCCGPEPMTAELVTIARRLGASLQASHEERMACAIGVCMGCAYRPPGSDQDEQGAPNSRLTYRRLCVEGPVIHYK